MPPRRAALAVTVAVVASSLVGCSRERVPLPGADATPEEVVTAYIKAFNAGDCDSMAALSDPVNSVKGWCGRINASNVTFGEPFADVCCGPGQEHEQVIHLPVEFRTRGGDSSMPDGDHVWGYILVRDRDGERWRVAAEGVG